MNTVPHIVYLNTYKSASQYSFTRNLYNCCHLSDRSVGTLDIFKVISCLRSFVKTKVDLRYDKKLKSGSKSLYTVLQETN